MCQPNPPSHLSSNSPADDFVVLKDIRVLVPIGLLHAVSHLTVVLGLGAGAVSFVHTVKASEACFTALLSFLLLGQVRVVPLLLGNRRDVSIWRANRIFRTRK